MEIKTTEEITEENYEHLDAWFTFDEDSDMRKEAQKKWVSVEDVIIELNCLKTHMYRSVDEDIDKLIILLKKHKRGNNND